MIKFEPISMYEYNDSEYARVVFGHQNSYIATNTNSCRNWYLNYVVKGRNRWPTTVELVGYIHD